MERSVALKKLVKLLGKKLGYKIDPKAPSPEERQVAQTALNFAAIEKKRISETMDQRRKALLDADPEYQKLAKEWQAIRKEVELLSWKARHKKICVGTSNELFFHVAAEGDSWEEVIAEVERRKAKNELFTA